MDTADTAADAPGAAAALALAEAQALQALPPCWRARIEDAALPCAPLDELRDLAEQVPSEFWRGYCLGVLVLRHQIAALTGR